MAARTGLSKGADIRDEALHLVRELPPGATWDDLMRRIYERLLLEERLAESAAGKVTSIDDVERELGVGR
jgi:hypothetical protein